MLCYSCVNKSCNYVSGSEKSRTAAESKKWLLTLFLGTLHEDVWRFQCRPWRSNSKSEIYVWFKITMVIGQSDCAQLRRLRCNIAHALRCGELGNECRIMRAKYGWCVHRPTTTIHRSTLCDDCDCKPPMRRQQVPTTDTSVYDRKVNRHTYEIDECHTKSSVRNYRHGSLGHSFWIDCTYESGYSKLHYRYSIRLVSLRGVAIAMKYVDMAAHSLIQQVEKGDYLCAAINNAKL